MINYYFLSSEIKNIIKDVQEQNLTYLSNSKLKKLASTCSLLESKNIRGVIIEAGCALGGSSIVLAFSKSKDRKLKVYDVFGEIPPPSIRDGKDVHQRYNIIKLGESNGIGNDPYYGYIPDLYKKVVNSFELMGIKIDENNIDLIKGLISNTLQINEPVCLAHIDVDWYDPVYLCLERIEPWLTVGGSFIVDDYFDWSGCKKAVDFFFKDKKNNYYFDFTSGSLVITKLKS